MEVICLTGTPGTGKTTLAKKLARQLGFIYLNVESVVEKHKLHDSYDEERSTRVVDTDKINTFLEKTIMSARKKRGIIIDSHLSHYLPKEKVSLCIVCKCELKELKRRLEKKGYSSLKVRENMDAEIFDVCYNEAKEQGHKLATYLSG